MRTILTGANLIIVCTYWYSENDRKSGIASKPKVIYSHTCAHHEVKLFFHMFPPSWIWNPTLIVYTEQVFNISFFVPWVYMANIKIEKLWFTVCLILISPDWMASAGRMGGLISMLSSSGLLWTTSSSQLTACWHKLTASAVCLCQLNEPGTTQSKSLFQNQWSWNLAEINFEYYSLGPCEKNSKNILFLKVIGRFQKWNCATQSFFKMASAVSSRGAFGGPWFRQFGSEF